VEIKSLIKRGLYKIGLQVSGRQSLGWDPFLDMAKLSQAAGRPTVFDVGANVGQTVDLFRQHFDRPVIHAFEPGYAAFQDLKRNTTGIDDLHLNNVALGAHCERKLFVESSDADMSSFLEPGKDCWGTVTGRREVSVETVDAYCSRASVARIDILKSDTQGFDCEVLKGALGMFGEHRIHLVWMEIIFNQMYKGIPRFDEIFGLLSDRGLSLVSFYTMQYQNDRASWTDALFIDPEYRRES